MGYVSNSRAPERIMLYGDAGSGKSYAALSIAKRLPEITVRIAEVDWTSTCDRLLDGEFAGVTNVEVRTAYPDEWEEQLELSAWLRKDTRPGDFAVFDSLTHSWAAVQEWFVGEVFKNDPDQYWVDKRKEETTKANGFDGWEDWPYIKKQHNIVYKNLARVPGHLLITAEQTAIADGDKKDDRQLFTNGFRPAGRKQMAHLPATVAHLARAHNGDRTITTLKDRGRGLVQGAAYGDFFRDYLVKVAGWKLAAAVDEGSA